MTVGLRRLGQTEVHVSSIGLGLMQFGGGKGLMKAFYSHLSQGLMNRIIHEAWEGGINWFDTAELYGGGRSEKGLSNGLEAKGIRDEEVVIATKWWPLFRTSGNISGTISRRQEKLSPYTIDLYQVHQPYSFSSPEAEMNAMADLVEQGEIKTVGVSNFDVIRMRRAFATLKNRGMTLASNQVEYSLLNRTIETNGVLQTAKELGITIIAWGPLHLGLLTGKFHKEPKLLANRPFYRRKKLKDMLEESRTLIEALGEIAADHGATIAQVALSWLIHFNGVTIVAIPGASKPAHAEQNAAAMNLELTEKELTRIDELSRRFR